MSGIGRNAVCPCGSGLKYKKCCDGKLPWSEIIQEGPDAIVRNLSIRGKNLLFLQLAAAAVGVDPSKGPIDWRLVKRGMTEKAVQHIHEAVLAVWPGGLDLKRVLEQESRSSTGLYVGNYDPPSLTRGVTRHCLYSESILLVDPFTYPPSVRDQYNPLMKPDLYRSDTLQCLYTWFSMAPWIQAGIVKFIRVPGDFDRRLNWQCAKKQEARSKQPILEKILESTAAEEAETGEFAKQMKDMLILDMTDEMIIDLLKQREPAFSEAEIADYLRHHKAKQESHPYFTEPGVPGMQRRTSGANYTMARLTATISGSHLITDIPYRWKEIELDREEAGIDDGNWAPFAKALQNAPFNYLDNVSLHAAFTLRQEGRLEHMRAFLRKVWMDAQCDSAFAAENAENLAAELQQRVREAKDEWDVIDRDLLKWFGADLLAGTLGGGTLVATGSAAWLAAAGVAIAAGTHVGVAQRQRKTFENRFPAAFFLKCGGNKKA